MRSMLVVCLLATAANAAAPSPEGIWLGTLDAGAVKLKIAFHVNRAPDGKLSATMDSLSQSQTGIPLDKTTFTSPKLRLEMSKLGISFEGEVRGETLVGTFTQGKAFPLTLQRVAALERPKRPQEPKRPFPYREEEITINVPESYEPQRASGAVKLAGTLTLPPGKGPFPAVLFITGSGPEDRDETVFEHKPFLILSDALTRAGIATLRFDDRGTGSSGGSLKNLTTIDNARDTMEELAVLAKRPEIDPRAIGLVGHSEGGLIAPIVAAQSDVPRFLVLLAGTGMTGLEVLRLQTAAGMRVAGMSEAAMKRAQKNNDAIWRIAIEEQDAKKIEAKVRTALASDPEALQEALPALATITLWLRTFLALDPVPYLKKVKVPVLALNGARDLQVDVSNLPLIEKALRAGGNKDVTTVAMPELNHLFQHAKTGAVSEYANIEETMSPDVLTRVRDFVLRCAKR